MFQILTYQSEQKYKQFFLFNLRLSVRRLLPWRARRDRGRRRGGWTRRDRPRCRPRTEAARPSFRTSARPKPTSRRSRRNLTLEESGNKICWTNKTSCKRH